MSLFAVGLREERKNANDGSTVAPATVNRALETLRLIFNHLELKSSTRKEMFFDEEGQTRVVSVEEELAYFREASQPLRHIATVILQTGMRPDEYFGWRFAIWILRAVQFLIRLEKRRRLSARFQ